MALLRQAACMPGPWRWAGALALAAGVHAAGLGLGLGSLGSGPEPSAAHRPVSLHLSAERPAYVARSAEYRGAPTAEVERPRPLAAPPPAVVIETRLHRGEGVPVARPPETAGRNPLEPLSGSKTGEHSALESSRASREPFPRAARSPRLCDASDAPLAPGRVASARPTSPAFAGRAKRPGLHLVGKPIYPRACRRGECQRGRPCEGVGRWRVVVERAGARPGRVEMLDSAGCSRLDASVRKFLLESNIPVAGEFEIRLRFRIEDDPRR